MRYTSFLVWVIYILIGCSEGHEYIDLPFDKDKVWYYDVRGFMSLQRFPAASLLDSSEVFDKALPDIPERDTIEVYIA